MKLFELCQEEDSDCDDIPPRGKYSKFSDDESSYTERLDSDQTSQPVDPITRSRYLYKILYFYPYYYYSYDYN